MLARRLPALALLAILTSACVVGPNFKPPAPPSVVDRRGRQQPQTTAATPGVPGGEAQHFVAGADIPADWWTLFHSPQLNALIEQALAHNPDLKAAQAALLVAHENTRAQRGAYLPQVSAGASITRREGSVGDARAGAGEQCVRSTRWSRRSSASPTCPTCSA